MSSQISADSNLLNVFRTAFPDFDLTAAGGFLQLFLQLFYIAAGFAAATFVAKWASDETDGRLEEVLATPLPRGRWVVAGGIAALLAVAVTTLFFALAIGLGGASGGVAVGTAMLGSASLGLYAAAVVGLGFAVGGLWRTSLAGEVAAIGVVATYLVDLLAPPLGLPDWVHQLALTSHLGQPMVGQWDPVGVIACAALAIGGIAVGRVGDRPSRPAQLGEVLRHLHRALDVAEGPIQATRNLVAAEDVELDAADAARLRLRLGEEHRRAPQALATRRLVDLDLVDEEHPQRAARPLRQPEPTDRCSLVLDHEEVLALGLEPLGQDARDVVLRALERHRARVAAVDLDVVGVPGPGRRDRRRELVGAHAAQGGLDDHR